LLIKVENFEEYNNIIEKLYKNIMFDMFIFFLKTTISDQWKELMIFKFFNYLTFLLFFLFILKLHKYQKSFEIYFSFFIFIIIILFEIFEKNEIFYQINFIINDIHLIYFILIFFLIIYIIYVIIFASNNLQLLLFPFTAYTFIILSKTPNIKILLFIFHIQYNELLIPFMNKVNELCLNLKKNSNSHFQLFYIQLLHIAGQIYLLSEPFYQFNIGMEEKFRYLV
jgi:hypothetical protein